MKTLIETSRLILRELTPEDATGIFQLDSDPEVQKFLGARPITTLQEAEDTIAYIRQQYQQNGIGRWATINKTTGQFLGWSGLKLITDPINNHVNYYDLGYRFMKKHWGIGYATEASQAILNYAFGTMQLKEVFAMADVRNNASQHVLQKVGLKQIGEFNFQGQAHYWYHLNSDKAGLP